MINCNLFFAGKLRLLKCAFNISLQEALVIFGPKWATGMVAEKLAVKAPNVGFGRIQAVAVGRECDLHIQHLAFQRWCASRRRCEELQRTV